jgi:uncharacterized LabA/DUF88 family protein
MSGVHVYIDGYNFYCGINKPGWLKYGWCNFSKLAKRLAERAFGNSAQVDEVKYYTAPVRLGREENRPGESERQKMWLDAIEAETPEVKIIRGGWQKIGNKPRVEKQTDVNIAVDMQWDTLKSERVILVSGDSDFIPAIRGARKAGKPVVVFLPPNTDRYESPPDFSLRIEEIKMEDLADCRLQETILVPGKPSILWSEYLKLRRQAGLSTI